MKELLIFPWTVDVVLLVTKKKMKYSNRGEFSTLHCTLLNRLGLRTNKLQTSKSEMKKNCLFRTTHLICSIFVVFPS